MFHLPLNAAVLYCDREMPNSFGGSVMLIFRDESGLIYPQHFGIPIVATKPYEALEILKAAVQGIYELPTLPIAVTYNVWHPVFGVYSEQDDLYNRIEQEKS